MALKLFSAAGTAFLVLVIGAALTGGGLGRSTVPEPLNTVLVFVTWIALLAVLPLLAAAGIAALVAIVGSSARPTGRRSPRRRRTNSDADAPRQNRILVVLLILSVGGVLLFVATAQRPSLDYVPIGLGLLAVGIIALLIVLVSRLINIVRKLAAQRRTL